MLRGFLRRIQLFDDAGVPGETAEAGARKLSARLTENEEAIAAAYGNSPDLILRRFRVGRAGFEASVAFIAWWT